MLNFLSDLVSRSELWAAIAGIAAVVSSLVAWGESRARAKDVKQYAAALEAVINAGQYVTHLRGMEERMASLNSAFEQFGRVVIQVSEHMKQTAASTRGVVELANKHIEGALKNVETATAAITDISKSLTDVANAARQSQRESLRAHKELMKSNPASGRPDQSAKDG
jgi:methyl-accepting chemotaxis protein